MWDYSEKDIEQYFLKKKIFEIDGAKYQIISNQFRITIPESVTPQNQLNIFNELKMLPIVEGIERVPDFLAYKIPKMQKGKKGEIRICEIKNRPAILKDVSQLNQYINLIKFLIKHNIGGINKKLKITKTFNVKGFLFARAIPIDVWLATNALHKSNDRIELIGYEIKSNKIRKSIKKIDLLNFTKKYRTKIKYSVRKYKNIINFNIE